jgi:hypothetical protein
MIWKKNAVTFPNGKEWASNQKWLTAPDPQGHEDAVRYLTYGCAFRLVDGVDKKFQTYHTAPDTHPTIWVCMCSRKCMACYDISDKNTTDVLTRKRGNTDPTYFQAQTTECVNFTWLPAPEEMTVTVPSWKTVDAGLPANGFGVPDIYVEEGDKDKDADRLFVDGDGDYGEETCED